MAASVALVISVAKKGRELGQSQEEARQVLDKILSHLGSLHRVFLFTLAQSRRNYECRKNIYIVTLTSIA